MEQKEVIPVYIDVRNGVTRCICSQDNKACERKCDKDLVERDRFRGWENMFRQDRYGQSRM